MTAFWLLVGFLAYGVVTGIVWLRFGRIPGWYGYGVLALAVVVGGAAFVLSQSQL